MEDLRNREIIQELSLKSTYVVAFSAMPRSEFAINPSSNLFNDYGKVASFNCLVEKPIEYGVLNDLVRKVNNARMILNSI